MIRIPLSWVEWAARKRLFKRPHFLSVLVSEGPLAEEMAFDLVYSEMRGGFSKWAHLVCPRCGDHIQLQTAGTRTSWSLKRDWLNRPTIQPSIWEKDSCGAHFFVRQGRLIWCKD
jgi:Family of unknown function (DUF6527)